MAGLAFTDENKSKSVFDVDLLRLKPKESARITFLDETATMAWAHYVKVGVSEKTGRPVGRYFKCLGYTVGDDGKVHDELLKTEQRNPDLCPACKVAQPGFDQRVGLARRRFVVQVGRYTTNTRGELIVPISMQLQAWVFGDDKFSKLTERAKVHGTDFRKKDLVIACVSEQFQNYDIDVLPTRDDDGHVVSPAWVLTPEGKAARKWVGERAFSDTELSRLICMAVSFDDLKAKTVDATPEIGRTDTAASAVADSVDDALANLSRTQLVDPEESDEPGIIEHSNDRGPVGVAAGVVDAVTADADFDKLLAGI